MMAQRGDYKYSSSPTVDSALEGGGCSTPRPEFYPRESGPVSIVQAEVWVSVGLDGCEKSPYQVSKPESSSPQEVAIPNTLSSLSLKVLC
jgi:hypothetical protein